jgi:hypothetical protein
MEKQTRKTQPTTSKKPPQIRLSDLAGIEYGGVSGGSQDCENAVLRILQFRDEIQRARILSHANSHCLLLTTYIGDLIAIKSGFSSGYGGEGPRRFSCVLQLLESFNIQIEEYIVPQEVLNRLDQSALTCTDLKNIDAAKPVRPIRLYEYIMEMHYESSVNGKLLSHFPVTIPFAIIDGRIMDLATTFWNNPDEKILTAYRRLEDMVRERTGLPDHGQKLFSKAFGRNGSALCWNNIDEGEREGRINLFTGAYMAHRNPRAHRELKDFPSKQLVEFLLLNHLYLLEKDSELISTS